MIRHSSVFLLLTTPALSEAPNYVLDHEYPLAAELGLPVLAVTAGGAASCPLAADAVCPLDDPQTLRDLLRQLLRRAALSRAAAPDGYPLLSRRMTALLGGSAGDGLLDTLLDPFQYYWLGLAYLNGIDVETDRARALRFLMLSAESGHPEAARKLSACYAAGIGTAPDAAAAARWQEYYLDSLEEEGTEGTKDTDDGGLLARYMEWNSLFLYRAAAGETGWLPEAQEKLHALMQSLEQRGCLPPAAAAEDLCREGILLALREDRDGAEIRYREALRQLEELRGRIEPSYHDLIAAQIRFLQADSAGDCGRTEEAILRYRQSLDELRHDAGDATAFWRMYCGMRLGELLLQTPRMAEALPVLQAALASADRLLSSPDMAPAPQDLVRLHKDLGLLLSPSDPEGARAHFLEARQTAQKLLGGGQPDAGLFRDSCWILYFMGTLSSFTPAEREAYLLECQERANDLPDKEKAALLTAASLALKRLKLAGTGRKIRDRLKNLFRPR